MHAWVVSEDKCVLSVVLCLGLGWRASAWEILEILFIADSMVFSDSCSWKRK